MAWEPKNKELFKTAYMTLGSTLVSLAKDFESTRDKVDKYVTAAIATGELPRKGDFAPLPPKSRSVQEEALLDEKVRERLRKSQTNVQISELANAFDVSPRRITESIARLQAQHVLVDTQGNSARIAQPESGKLSEIALPYSEGNRIRFGFVTDAHMCSKYSQVDKLHLFYKLATDRGITTFFDAGNWIDGEARFNKTDLLVHGMDNQIKYWAEHWPRYEGVTTHFVGGDDHEGWYQQREGINIGQHAEDVARRCGREDLVHLGYMEHDVVIQAPNGQTTIRVQHPGGGTAYALSYTPQKIVESLTGGEKPNILLLGHYHKSGYFFLRNIHTFMGGCFQAQSPFMRKKRLAAHVGGWIIEFIQGEKGDVLEMTQTFIPFYEVSSFIDKWEYQF